MTDNANCPPRPIAGDPEDQAAPVLDDRPDEFDSAYAQRQADEIKSAETLEVTVPVGANVPIDMPPIAGEFSARMARWRAAPVGGSAVDRVRADGKRGLTKWEDLARMKFPPVLTTVEGVLVEGTTLLSGSPKGGKSYLSLELALAVATGTPAFGGLPVKQHPVVVLALEDNLRRIYDRCSQMLGGRVVPPGYLTFATSVAELGDDIFVDQMAAILRESPDTRLIVVDVLARVRPPRRAGAGVYDEDYAAGRMFSDVAALQQGLQLLVVHHSRKYATGADSAVSASSGSFGLPGAFDSALWLVADGDRRALLHRQGRDLDQLPPLALEIPPDRPGWQLAGPRDRAEPATGWMTCDQRIMSYLEARPEGQMATPAELVSVTGRKMDTVKRELKKLEAAGLVANESGLYRAVRLINVSDGESRIDHGILSGQDRLWLPE